MSEASEYKVEVHELAATPTAIMRRTVAWTDIPTALGEIYGKVMDYIQRVGAHTQGRVFARYEPEGDQVAIEAGLTLESPVDGEGEIEASWLPGGEAAVCLHVGPYDKVAEAYEHLTEWAKTAGRRTSGTPWEVYLTPPEEDPPITEVVFPLTEA